MKTKAKKVGFTLVAYADPDLVGFEYIPGVTYFSWDVASKLRKLLTLKFIRAGYHAAPGDYNHADKFREFAIDISSLQDSIKIKSKVPVSPKTYQILQEFADEHEFDAYEQHIFNIKKRPDSTQHVDWSLLDKHRTLLIEMFRAKGIVSGGSSYATSFPELEVDTSVADQIVSITPKVDNIEIEQIIVEYAHSIDWGVLVLPVITLKAPKKEEPKPVYKCLSCPTVVASANILHCSTACAQKSREAADLNTEIAKAEAEHLAHNQEFSKGLVETPTPTKCELGEGVTERPLIL